MDLNKLTLSDRIIVASGILLFIAYFLPWFEVSVDSGVPGVGDFSDSAKGSDVDFIWSTLPMLIGLVMAGVIIASKLFDVKLPDLPITWAQLHLALGALAAFLVVLKLIIGEDADGAELFGVDVSRAFGLFIAALAAIGLAVGGYLMFRDGNEPATTGGDAGTAPF